MCIGQIVLVFCLCHCHCLCLGVFFLSLPIAAIHPPSTPSSFLVVLVYPPPPWAPCPLDMRVWLSICSSGLGCVVGACVPSSTLVFLLPCFVALRGCFFWRYAPKSTHTIFSVPGWEESPKYIVFKQVAPMWQQGSPRILTPPNGANIIAEILFRPKNKPKHRTGKFFGSLMPCRKCGPPCCPPHGAQQSFGTQWEGHKGQKWLARQVPPLDRMAPKDRNSCESTPEPES